MFWIPQFVESSLSLTIPVGSCVWTSLGHSKVCVAWRGEQGFVDAKTRGLSDAIGQFHKVNFYPYFRKSTTTMQPWPWPCSLVHSFTSLHETLTKSLSHHIIPLVLCFGSISHSTTLQPFVLHLAFQVILLVSSQRMYARRTYSKTRTGCLQCKQRKIKVRK